MPIDSFEKLLGDTKKMVGLDEMSFKNFRFNVFIRITVLSVSIFIFSLLIGQSGYSATNLGLGILIIFQVIRLIKQVENTNREVVNLLNSIRYDDFSNSYKLSTEGESFEDLQEAFNKVMQKFREIRTEKEAQHHYLKTIIHHIGIGILSFDKKGDIQILNTTAKRLFKLNRLTNIEGLAHLSPELVAQLQNLTTGKSALIKIVQGSEIVQLSLYAIELTLQGKEYKLITLQNIHQELEEQEMEAWQRLIRVLTHEIMNSIAPISSLATTAEGEIEYLTEEVEEEGITAEDLEDIQLAVQTIKRRSQGLSRFVNDFRNMTHIPTPTFQNIRVLELVEDVVRLMQYDAEKANITLSCEINPNSLLVTVDKNMIAQILINLVKNAIQSLEKESKSDKKIQILAGLDSKSRPFITVRDNGSGIENEAIERIFIPFFSTKKGGSGIGLSLARQMMRLHQGSISAVSKPDEATDFILKF